MKDEPQFTVGRRSSHESGNDRPTSRGLIDVAALAERLGVTQRFVRRLTAEDRVPFLKIGKFVRFDPREIDEWVNGQRRPSVD